MTATAASERRDAFDVPLGDDLLIEASAGTGKTYALTTLVARLVVEEDRRIDELLIVTFTISAAGELRTRVRRTLSASRRAVEGIAADEQARKLAERWRRLGLRETDVLTRLTAAVRDFDRAIVTTIHGFCQRALVEFALHAPVPFAFAVSGDDALAVGANVRDFWRRRMAEESIPLLEYARSRNFVPDEDTIAWVAGHYAQQQDIRGAGTPEAFPEELRSQRNKWRAAVRSAAAAWSRSDQRSTFLTVVDKYKWRKGQKDESRIKTLIDAFDAGASEKLTPDHAGFFGRTSLASRLYQKNPPPNIELFDRFERVGETGKAYGDLWLANQRRRLLEDAGEGLHFDTWEHRRLGFDALLVELHRGLVGDHGVGLARRIRCRYPVALIDEFQDTDRLQADIFGRIYPGGDAEDGRLFVVGDPKQSIYRFRGADVFAYLEAQDRLAGSSQPLSLEHNYRSTPGLIHAVNALFARQRPFVLPEFEFARSLPAEREPGALVVEDNEGDRDPDEQAPFQVVLVPREDGKKRNKPDLSRLVAEQAAGEIARLLALGNDGRAQIGSDEMKPVAGGDIAVLVRTGRQGQAVGQALRALGIDSVEMGTENIFDSDEADALHRLLHALCVDESEYNATSLLRGALAADLFGLDMQALAGLRDDDEIWSHWQGLAREWADVWQQHGIATLMRHVLFAGEPDCSTNLLRYPDGPRRLTNYLHLTDLLHEAETRRRPSRQSLLDWFRQSRAESLQGDETAQLRLESDENLVRIVTVHRAKGLEFPIVFYPFAWDGRAPTTGRNRKPTAEFYDPHRKTPVLDLVPEDEAYDRERVEEHADELRLLYVALTRARYRCVVTWARDGRAEYAPLAWLLHGGDAVSEKAEQPEPARALDENARRVKGLSADEWQVEVQKFASRAPGGAVLVRTIDEEPPSAPDPADASEAEPLAARRLERELKRIRERTSYSALSAEVSWGWRKPDRDEVDLPDHDEATAIDELETASDPQPDDGPTIFTFPGGGRSGSCLHEILERHLGNPASSDLEQTCETVLVRYGFDRKWHPVACTMVQNALDTPLSRPGETDSVFRLSDLERPIRELEFHLPLHAFRRDELRRCLEAHGYDHLLPESDAEIHGFLHGYVDLVARHDGRWYVMDYKSNWLGPSLGAYTGAAIAASMRHHGYHLQYLLYLTALHRLLRLRLSDYDYDRDVGGVFYLFLRAMRPNVPGSGVFRDRPARACIEAIDGCFGEAP